MSETPNQPDAALGADAGRAARRRWALLATLLVFAATAAVFAPAVGYDFINYDDDWFVSNNPHVLQGVSWPNFVWAWTTPEMGYPKPLAILSWMLDAELYGNDASGFHLTNVLLHAASSGLLFVVLYLSTGSVFRSLLVVGLWALHPLRVEPVAWVTSRKDVLSALFGFGAWAAYVKAVRDAKGGWYAGSLALYACCLLSKPVFVTMPALLLLWDFWPLRRGEGRSDRRRLWVRLIGEKVPYAVLAAGLAVWVLLTRPASDATAAPLADRLANAAVSYARYLAKLVDFSSLAIPYPHRDWSLLVWGGSVVLLLVVTALAIAWRKRMPWVLVGWAWFVVAMVPMLRIKAFGDFSMGDRFAYLPTIGVTLAIVWCLPAPRSQGGRIAAAVAALVVVGTLAGFSRAQLAHWKNSATLFRHAIAVMEPEPHPTALVNYASHYWDLRDRTGEEGRHARAEAMKHYARVLERNPDRAPQAANYARLLYADGQVEKANRVMDRAYRSLVERELHPEMIEGVNKMGRAFLELGQPQRAEEVYAMGLELSGDVRDGEALASLANGLVELGRIEEARRLCRRAVEYEPRNPDLLSDYATVELRAGELDTAADLYRRALAIDADNPMYLFNLGRTLRMAGDAEAAQRALSAAVRLRPDWAEAHLELAAAESARGDAGAARRHYLRVVELGGPVADACNNLGVLAARRGDLQTAGQWFQRAVQADPDHAGARANLARLRQALGER